MIKHIVGAVSMVALVAACSSTPEVQKGPDAEVIMGNLHKVDNTRSDLAYVDPDADFSKYTKILLLPLDVDNVKIKQPDTSGSINRNRSRKWELTDQDKVKLQEEFRNSMVKQIEGKGGYPIVTEAGPDVLTLQPSLIGLAPSAPKDDNVSRAAGRSYTYTEGAGSMAVMVVLGDSESREMLALVKDSRATNSYWGRNNSVSNLSDIRSIFNSWALGIRKALDKVHGK